MWTEVSRAAVQGGEMVSHTWRASMLALWLGIELTTFWLGGNRARAVLDESMINDRFDFLTCWLPSPVEGFCSTRHIYHVHFCVTFSYCCSFDAKSIWISNKTTTVLKFWICVDLALVYANGPKLPWFTNTPGEDTKFRHIAKMLKPNITLNTFYTLPWTPH